MTYTFKHSAIEGFKRTYPCSGIPELESISFEMESNGDLVDVIAIDMNGEYIDSAEFDGSGLLALSEDARAVVLAQ